MASEESDRPRRRARVLGCEGVAAGAFTIPAHIHIGDDLLVHIEQGRICWDNYNLTSEQVADRAARRLRDGR